MKRFHTFYLIAACSYCSFSWSGQDIPIDPSVQVSGSALEKIEKQAKTPNVSAGNSIKDGVQEEKEKNKSSERTLSSTNPTEFPHEAYVAMGTVLAAIFTGIITITNMLISKDREITQERAIWLKDLTNTLARLCSEVELIVRLVECENCSSENGMDIEKLKKIRTENKDHYKNLNEAFYVAHMQLDRDKDKAILGELSLLHTEFYNTSCANLIKIQDLNRALMEKGQLLNEEIWEKMKSGDRPFRYFFRIVATLLLLLLFYLHYQLRWF